jgi:4-carboxymuconolactone decarboxylase
MSLIDPLETAARGAALQTEVMGQSPVPRTPFEASLRDFVFADVWSRPGLDRRARLLTSMSGALLEGDQPSCAEMIGQALSSGALTLLELREAALQMVVYGGWGAGRSFDRLVSVAAEALNLTEPALVPLQAEVLTRDVLNAQASNMFEHVARMPAPPLPSTPYVEVGVLGFVMGRVWGRPGLDERSRRIITLVGAGFSGSDTPMRVHAYSAMASGNLTKAEMLEFVLHFSIHAGWPRGSVFQRAVVEQASRVEQGLAFQI